MHIKTQLQNFNGEEIAAELNGYGLPIVGVDPAGWFPGKPQGLLQRFITRYSIARDTPFIFLPSGSVIAPAAKVGDIEAVWTGWQYMPNAPVETNAMHEVIVKRLADGLPVTLVPQTAKALRLDAHDLQALDLNWIERQMLIRMVKQQRRSGAVPILIGLAFANGQRRNPRWWLSIARCSVAQHFVSLNRNAALWADES